MNTLQRMVLWMALACGAIAPAQAQPSPPSTTPLPQQGETMATKEKIQQLKPATNFVELMQLLRAIHEQVLLIDPYFMEDENILRLFGQGTIQEQQDPNGRNQFKRFIPSERNPLRFPIWLMGAKTPPGYGSLVIGDYKLALPFNHELIETYLIPGVQGEDPYGPLKPMTNEARDIAGGRPLATHPKGYWKYLTREKTTSHMADVYVVLDLNAQVLKIDLTQKGYQK